MAGLSTPLSTLRPIPRGMQRMTRGPCGLLVLQWSGTFPLISTGLPAHVAINSIPAVCSTLQHLFANTMLMFRLMFFHIKNPPKRVLSCCNVFFRHISGTSPHQRLSKRGTCTTTTRNLLVFSALHTAEIHVNYVPLENPDPRRFSV